MSLIYINDPSKISENDWNDFVTGHPQGNIFQLPEMYHIYEKSENYDPIFIGCLSEKGEIRGLLISAIFSEKKGIWKKLSARSLVLGGPILYDEVPVSDFLKYYEITLAGRVLYTRLIKVLNSYKLDDSFITAGYKYNDHLNYIIDLTSGEDDIWNEISNTRRRQIKRGYRRGISVKICSSIENVEELYKLLKGTYDRAGLPLQDISFFSSVQNGFSHKGKIAYFLAYEGERLIGCRIVLLDGDTVRDWFAGDLPEARDKYTNDVLVWEVLKWSKQHNYKEFDFGGAGEPDKEYGVREFKKKFGGKLISQGNFMKIHLAFRYFILQKCLPVYKYLKKRTV